MTEGEISKAGFEIHNAVTSALFHALLAYKFGDEGALETARGKLREGLENSYAALPKDAPEAPPVAAE